MDPALEEPSLHPAVTWLVETLGAPGLALVAFLDSSFLSLPEANDLLVMTMVIADPVRFWLYALSATAGSVVGCGLLQLVGRKGGRELLLRRLDPARAERLESLHGRFDVLSVLIPSLLPPPCPFKLFVLSAGVFQMPVGRFLLTVAAGRGARYLLLSWLAVYLGQDLLVWVQTHALEAALLAVAVAGALWVSWRVADRRLLSTQRRS